MGSKKIIGGISCALLETVAVSQIQGSPIFAPIAAVSGFALLALSFKNLSEWKALLYGFIPLQNAAKKAYEFNRKHVFARMAEMDITNDDAAPYHWFATALIGGKISERLQVYMVVSQNLTIWNKCHQ